VTASGVDLVTRRTPVLPYFLNCPSQRPVLTFAHVLDRSASFAGDHDQARTNIKKLKDVKLKVKARQLLGDALFVAAVLDADDLEELTMTVQDWGTASVTGTCPSYRELPTNSSNGNLITRFDDSTPQFDD
jgi:hypothetical protein